ncbi:MAG: fmt, partial [Firmicutes bacterium]|nr:fmt [Bacillota bacterium]
ETETGVATMYMDAGLDTGDVILERTVSIDPEETTGQLYERLRLIGADLLVQTLGKVATKTVTRTPQDNNRATYAKLLTRDIEGINWRYSAQQIHNLIRGLNPWPGAYCEHSGKILKIWRSKVSRSSGSFGQCGQVLSISETGCQIATSDGIIELLEVQPESKKRMTAGEYVRGYGMNVGEILG